MNDDNYDPGVGVSARLGNVVYVDGFDPKVRRAVRWLLSSAPVGSLAALEVKLQGYMETRVANGVLAEWERRLLTSCLGYFEASRESARGAGRQAQAEAQAGDGDEPYDRKAYIQSLLEPVHKASHRKRLIRAVSGAAVSGAVLGCLGTVAVLG